ncbi:hypothetical protein B0T24DRAFT_670483 [Lasiosphaeria ovina]|uniref:Uncharacterized protein n=1 Tax=Lasiosphaeria ovina TaxID=92902 RepID=A0AAE0JVW7_9PEZI|nr:hypothetical protein B0T24DRAFT_670483 [Lasiosphaeria ovina]
MSLKRRRRRLNSSSPATQQQQQQQQQHNNPEAVSSPVLHCLITMSPFYRAKQLYRRRFPHGHHRCASAEVESQHMGGAADDMRLSLVHSLFAAIISAGSSDPSQRQVLDSRLQGMRDSNYVPRHVLKDCPTTSKSAAIRHIANAIAGYLSRPVRSEPRIELVGIFIPEPPQDGDLGDQAFSVKFLRRRVGRRCHGDAQPIFIEVCPWSQHEFRGVREARLGPPDRSGTAGAATGGDEAWWWGPSSRSNAAEPVQARRQRRQNRETTVAADRGNELQEALPPPVRILQREEPTDWNGIIKWICAALFALALFGVVVYIDMLGSRLFTGFSNAVVGVGSLGTQLMAFLGRVLSPAADRISRPIRPYKVPLLKRRAIDPAVLILKDVFLQNSVQLEERRLAYTASLTDMVYDQTLGELASTMGDAAQKLTETERPVTSGLEELHVNVMDEFYQLWGIETRFQIWEDGLPATTGNDQQVRPPTLRRKELARLRSTLWDITKDLGKLLLGSVSNRTQLLSDLKKGSDGASTVYSVYSKMVRTGVDSESARLRKRVDLIHKYQADKAEAEVEAEAERRRRRWWRWLSSRSGNGNTELPEGLDVAHAAILDQASNAMGDLAGTMSVVVSVMGRVYITLTLEHDVVKEELEELRRLGDRVRYHANMIRENPNPQLPWLKTVAQEAMSFVQDAWDILSRYHAHEVTDVAVR